MPTTYVHPDVLADHLETVARHLRTGGTQAIQAAHTLAARGYPSSTLGTGPRSTSDTTSTERAALDPDPWAGIDDTLAHLVRRAWKATLDLDSLVVRLLAHASDDDPIPAGRGHCQACETFCIGDGQNDRLRDGFCHPCRSAWDRWRRGHPLGLRPDFIRHRRRVLGMGVNNQAVGA